MVIKTHNSVKLFKIKFLKNFKQHTQNILIKDFSNCLDTFMSYCSFLGERQAHFVFVIIRNSDIRGIQILRRSDQFFPRTTG